MWNRCRRPSLLSFVLLLMGLRVMRHRHASAEERAAYRSKRKQFRGKLAEAFAVWDDDDEEGSPESL